MNGDNSKFDVLDELNKKSSWVKNGLCSYCGRSPETPLCRMPAMHILPLMSQQSNEDQW